MRLVDFFFTFSLKIVQLSVIIILGLTFHSPIFSCPLVFPLGVTFLFPPSLFSLLINLSHQLLFQPLESIPIPVSNRWIFFAQPFPFVLIFSPVLLAPRIPSCLFLFVHFVPFLTSFPFMNSPPPYFILISKPNPPLSGLDVFRQLFPRNFCVSSF